LNKSDIASSIDDRFNTSTTSIYERLIAASQPVFEHPELDVQPHLTSNNSGSENPISPQAIFNFFEEDNWVTRGSASSAKAWTIKERYRQTKLPNEGKIRFVPDKNYNPIVPFRKTDDKKGYYDRMNNIWRKGPSRTLGLPFEWDVTLSETGRNQLGWAASKGKQLNVSLDGRITHKT
jgi:filamentous hemagglutinin